MGGDISIEPLAIGCHHILDIGDILQASFNLERRRACLYQLCQMVALVEILQRQQMALVDELLAVAIE